MTNNQTTHDYDYIIIGSGFGGSVSALRLAEKGYKVLVLEKGKRLGANDFPKTNWHLRKWMWLPKLKMTGLFKLTFYRHVAVVSGVGVGGGSLVYANTLTGSQRRIFSICLLVTFSRLAGRVGTFLSRS
jgi:cholesterol oxidase